VTADSRAIAWAIMTTARSNPAMALALASGCPPRGTLRANAVYGYFRWADDVVDAPDREDSAVQRFMVRQEDIIHGRTPALHPAEGALRWALTQPGTGPRLQAPVKLMAEALSYDAYRAPGPIPAADLQQQVERIGDAFVGAIWVCSGAEGNPSDAALLLARAATATHMLRDREEDALLGYHNLPREHFGDVAPTTGPELEAWLTARAVEVQGWFADGLASCDDIRPPRTRRLVTLLGRRYQRTLRGISPPSPPESGTRC
jgi:phytoene/squalene synthetase